MFSFKVQLLVLGVLKLAYGQYIDPVLGPLAPLPNHLIAIRGPLYVDASSLVPAGQMQGPSMPLGPAMPLGPPMLPNGPTQIIAGPPVVGPPVLGPPMQQQFGPGFLQLAYDETNDPVNQRPGSSPSGPSRRSANTNVQSGIQQFGTGNMNLQGNIQQISQP